MQVFVVRCRLFAKNREAQRWVPSIGREKSQANSDRPRGLSMKQGFAAAGVPNDDFHFIAKHSIDNFIFD